MCFSVWRVFVQKRKRRISLLCTFDISGERSSQQHPRWSQILLTSGITISETSWTSRSERTRPSDANWWMTRNPSRTTTLATPSPATAKRDIASVLGSCQRGPRNRYSSCFASIKRVVNFGFCWGQTRFWRKKKKKKFLYFSDNGCPENAVIFIAKIIELLLTLGSLLSSGSGRCIERGRCVGESDWSAWSMGSANRQSERGHQIHPGWKQRSAVSDGSLRCAIGVVSFKKQNICGIRSVTLCGYSQTSRLVCRAQEIHSGRANTCESAEWTEQNHGSIQWQQVCGKCQSWSLLKLALFTYTPYIALNCLSPTHILICLVEYSNYCWRWDKSRRRWWWRRIHLQKSRWEAAYVWPRRRCRQSCQGMFRSCCKMVLLQDFFFGLLAISFGMHWRYAIHPTSSRKSFPMWMERFRFWIGSLYEKENIFCFAVE